MLSLLDDLVLLREEEVDVMKELLKIKKKYGVELGWGQGLEWVEFWVGVYAVNIYKSILVINNCCFMRLRRRVLIF